MTPRMARIPPRIRGSGSPRCPYARSISRWAGADILSAPPSGRTPGTLRCAGAPYGDPKTSHPIRSAGITYLEFNRAIFEDPSNCNQHSDGLPAFFDPYQIPTPAEPATMVFI